MATEHDDECLPPTEFILSTIQHEKSVCDHVKAIENNPGATGDADRGGGHCSNCLRHVTGLFCPRCVIHQTALPDKLRALASLREDRQALLDEYCQSWYSGEQYSTGESVSEALVSKNELESNIGRLSTLIRLKRDVLRRNSETLTRIRSERSQRLKTVSKLRQLVDFTQKQYSVASRTISVASLDRRCRDLAGTRQRMVFDLMNNVFPLDAVSPTSTNAATCGSIVASSLVEFEAVTGVTDILTDAALTTFSQDRWIFMGSSPDVQYRLVHSCLTLDHSDYSQLKGWLFNEAASSGRTTSSEVIVSNPPLASLENASYNRSALGTLSALAYCAQLVNVLARVLDIRLPFTLTFSDFFIDKLKEAELDTAIVKLNANVALLCCTQRMDYDSICFERPFWNLCNLSKNVGDLGYQSYFTVDARVARGFANAEKRIMWQERAMVTVTETADDWENIDEQVPEWTGAPSSPPTLSQLWTSAATSVANLFKMHN